MTPKRKKDTTCYPLHYPTDLHWRLKALCARRRISMKNAMIDIIKNWVEVQEIREKMKKERRD